MVRRVTDFVAMQKGEKMRLIDKDQVMKSLSITEECKDCPFCSKAIFCGKSQDFVNACEAICDAHVVEIIHCRDCKYWDEFPSSTINIEYHKCSGFPIFTESKSDDFCSRGERK